MTKVLQRISMIQQYRKNKFAEVGYTCICPSCGTVFIKNSYQQAFCKTKGGTKCKDKYWNTVSPEKRCNTTRISPANRKYYQEVIEPRLSENFDDDPSWDAHKNY